MSSDIHKKDQNEVHVAKIAGGNKGLFNTAMNDQQFLNKVAKKILAQNKINTELSSMLKQKKEKN
tara:strand:+ start:2009 stop:2203 length:195 start_codon:yes stop_codon:yes gene_type:complete